MELCSIESTKLKLCLTGLCIKLREELISDNSFSISYEGMKELIKPLQSFTNEQIKDYAMCQMEFLIDHANLGVCESFYFDEEDEEFEDGKLKPDDGLSLYLSDDFIHDDFATFEMNERKHYEDMTHIKEFYDKVSHISNEIDPEILYSIIFSSDDNDYVEEAYKRVWQLGVYEQIEAIMDETKNKNIYMALGEVRGAI